jgi:adenylate cyclase
MGYGTAAHLTAIGDVVNTASRLEHANKQLGSWLVFSGIVAEHAGMQNLPTELERRVQLRGKSEPLGVYAIAKGEIFAPNFSR